jgi:hypothetical protein
MRSIDDHIQYLWFNGSTLIAQVPIIVMRRCAVHQTIKSINMSTKRRQRSQRQSPQVPGSSSSNTGGTTSSTGNEGCRKCGKDDDHSHLLLCEACNDEYHTHCLDPPLDYVPEGDFFCGKYRISRAILLLPTVSYYFYTDGTVRAQR